MKKGKRRAAQTGEGMLAQEATRGAAFAMAVTLALLLLFSALLAKGKAPAALLDDLKISGLLDTTLVVWGGEFGRSPVAENGKGRDHHPKGFTMWMAGAGIKGGQMYGSTDEFGYAAVENRVHDSIRAHHLRNESNDARANPWSITGAHLARFFPPFPERVNIVELDVACIGWQARGVSPLVRVRC